MAVTEKKLDDLMVGDYVCDMHDDLPALHNTFKVVSHVRWDEPRLRRDWDQRPEFWRYLDQFVQSGYVNKCLYVIGFDDVSTLGEPVVVCGYSYDHSKAGIIVIARKP